MIFVTEVTRPTDRGPREFAGPRIEADSFEDARAKAPAGVEVLGVFVEEISCEESVARYWQRLAEGKGN